eukprot:363513-Chlamydomonas_euryale.AAC.8
MSLKWVGFNNLIHYLLGKGKLGACAWIRVALPRLLCAWGGRTSNPPSIGVAHTNETKRNATCTCPLPTPTHVLTILHPHRYDYKKPVYLPDGYADGAEEVDDEGAEMEGDIDQFQLPEYVEQVRGRMKGREGGGGQAQQHRARVAEGDIDQFQRPEYVKQVGD